MKTILVVLAALSLSLSLILAAHQPVSEPSPNPGGDPSSLVRAGIEGSLPDPRRQGDITLQQLTASWMPAAREAARQMMDRYGGPQEATANRLIWHDNRPWKTTEVVNDGVVHNFPVPHHDVLIQTLAIDVPAEKFGVLAQFDGSVTAGRTTGELSVRCDREENNYIVLNLANDVIEGKLTVAQARLQLASLEQAVKAGQKPVYAGGIQFSLPVSNRTGDPDHSTAGPDWQQSGQ
jgi:hypothetical protein